MGFYLEQRGILGRGRGFSGTISAEINESKSLRIRQAALKQLQIQAQKVILLQQFMVMGQAGNAPPAIYHHSSLPHFCQDVSFAHYGQWHIRHIFCDEMAGAELLF